jgi:hypothetical protein
MLYIYLHYQKLLALLTTNSLCVCKKANVTYDLTIMGSSSPVSLNYTGFYTSPLPQRTIPLLFIRQHLFLERSSGGRQSAGKVMMMCQGAMQ